MDWFLRGLDACLLRFKPRGLGLRVRLLGLAKLRFSALPVFFGFAFWLALLFPKLLGEGSNVIMRGVVLL
jgi:hypothetical protein